MTLAFAFRIKDAWVIVADKLEIDKDYKVIFDGRENRTRIDNKCKIRFLNSKNLIFVGAGDCKLLERFIKMIILSKDLNEFNSNFQDNCQGLNSGEFELDIPNTEFILINQKELTAYRYINGKKYKLIETLENSFIGSTEALRDLSGVKTNLLKMWDKTMTPSRINNLISILENLAAQRLESIGHPAIDGCDIWVIKKRAIKKYLIIPKEYKWRLLP